MKPYGNQLNLRKKVSYESKKDSKNLSITNIKLIHQIFDTINISLLVLIMNVFSEFFLLSYETFFLKLS